MPPTRGWYKGMTLSAIVSRRWRRGVLVSKKGTKWIFRPNGYKRTISICPIRHHWRYDFTNPIKKWDKKIAVTLTKKTNMPFKYKRERVGKWSGAATCRTYTAKLPVWQVPNTNVVYVGHLGMYSMAKSMGLKLIKTSTYNDQTYIGRGKLTPKSFISLKCQPILNIKVDHRKTIAPLYKTLTRDALGG